jgi:prolyl 4-hydroxylase
LQYTAHHDFGYSKINDENNGARFATLLFYLNEPTAGGETSFPRWQNAETFEELKVTPEVGKAVLFYSQLPDGNMDDFSQHAALPIKEGEKWLINLWVWDPVYE